ncbi:Ppx/GppA phosphatase family protein [Campylobacter troglodytis]|uniref:Ppx/GppA phosphatase family protein n=1 Tax=Campylobacter troglodytis TaxID=654363 RepID=UPI001158E01F|nr:Ppx/GppA phosphatase family protein [Campylobacter troglodytis]TQR57702.1 Ppx/GppA family phosphatase [Campylobacter troglodytis]
MAKRTAIVDLGSNSVRLVIFEKTSRYAFHILCEHKRKVRIGENAYNNGKVLQEEAMQRAEDTLAYFKEVSLKQRCKKILIVGTSALRDAPNRKIFIKNIKDKLGLNIRCIDGKTESYLGGLAALNLLSNIKNATTLDIGGGSSELCLIKEGRIEDCISLDLGTVRLKELFYDQGKEKELQFFLEDVISQIPPHFNNDKLIAIGGSLRAISNAIIEKNSYPLQILHEFNYKLKDEENYIKELIEAPYELLGDFHIKKERFDTIKEGALIFLNVAKKLQSKEIITSGVGIREGVYLNDILPISKKFPPKFNPSIKSLQDRFLGKTRSKIPLYASEIFEALSSLHGLNEGFKTNLINAAKLCDIGSYLDFYYARDHSAYFILNALNYNFSHQEKILVALLIKLDGRKPNGLLEPYKDLLPAEDIIIWLNFILALAKLIAQDYCGNEKIDFVCENNTLYIYSQKQLNITNEALRKIVLPQNIIIILNEKP